jgi:hypothetical protein
MERTISVADLPQEARFELLTRTRNHSPCCSICKRIINPNNALENVNHLVLAHTINNIQEISDELFHNNCLKDYYDLHQECPWHNVQLQPYQFWQDLTPLEIANRQRRVHKWDLIAKTGIAIACLGGLYNIASALNGVSISAFGIISPFLGGLITGYAIIPSHNFKISDLSYDVFLKSFLIFAGPFALKECFKFETPIIDKIVGIAFGQFSTIASFWFGLKVSYG